jgi:ornithine cyclodeaminase/alanine dehydrogenase-like protein (mu-crystallin family)
MLIINQEEIKRNIKQHQFIDAIEEAMLIYESGRFEMPMRMNVDFGKDSLLLMPCVTENFFGTKLVSLFPDNPTNNLPVLHGLMVLNDGKTGEPLALMNGALITGLRTAAIGSLSIKYMTDESVSKLGMIGAGVQGYYQTLMACSVRKFTDVYLSDLNPQKLEELQLKLQNDLPDVNIHKTNSPDEVLQASHVIITATNTTTPLFANNKALFSGKHFVAIGSYKPEMREYPQAIYNRLDHVFIDTDHAFHETGDLITPLNEGWISKEQVVSFGKILTGEIILPKNTNSTLFKSVGMALFDIVTANMIYCIAKEKGFGMDVML